MTALLITTLEFRGVGSIKTQKGVAPVSRSTFGMKRAPKNIFPGNVGDGNGGVGGGGGGEEKINAIIKHTI
jgi:hypothetical protein